MNAIVPECIWPVGAQLGEGALWHPVEAAVYFVDIKGHRIHRLCVDTFHQDSWPAPAQPGFIVPVDDARFICGLSDGLYVFEPSAPAGEQFRPWMKVEPEHTGNRLNDGYVDAQGRLWFGSMDDGESQATGSLFMVNSNGALIAKDRGYVITNGPALSPDGLTLYHADTLKRVVYAFDMDSDGGIANKRAFLNFGDYGHPDGMAVDSEGCVWVAFFGGWRIDRFSPQGGFMSSVRFPCANVTKLAFGGSDLRTVYATTATKGLSPDELVQQPLAGGLFTFRAPTSGLPPHRFNLGATA